MYKLAKYDGIEFIIRVADHASIPMNSENADYQAYLKWLEEGNTPLPADEAAE